MNGTRYLALDIGGSKIEAGLVSSDGGVLCTNPVDAHPHCSRDEFLADVKGALAPFLAEPAAGLGVGFPGLVNPATGVISRPSRSVFPAMENFGLRDYLQRECRAPTKVDNDGNLYTLGVYYFGEGRPYDNLVGLALGTNVGIGVIQDGALAQGESGVDGKAERIFTQCSGWRLHCGSLFPHVYGADGRTLARHAQAGQPYSLSCFELMGSALALTVRALRHIYPSVQAVILGGSIAKSYDFFAPALKRDLQQGGVSVEVDRTRLPHPTLAGAPAMFRR